MAAMKRLGLIGKKIGMTQVFGEDGSVVPVTVVEAGPCKILQIKTKGKEGYGALQLGYGPKREKSTTKPLMGKFSRLKCGPYHMLREFRVEDPSTYEVGSDIKVDIFSVGSKVDVIGTSIGKGFAGVVKRHGFSGGPKTHGSKSHDVPGSIGSSADPSRVWPGQKLPGRMGGKRVTIRNLSIVSVDPERNLILLRGAVPCKRDSYLLLRPAVGRVTKRGSGGESKAVETVKPAKGAGQRPA